MRAWKPAASATAPEGEKGLCPGEERALAGEILRNHEKAEEALWALEAEWDALQYDLGQCRYLDGDIKAAIEGRYRQKIEDRRWERGALAERLCALGYAAFPTNYRREES